MVFIVVCVTIYLTCFNLWFSLWFVLQFTWRALIYGFHCGLYPASDARRNSLGPAKSMRRGKRMKTRACPVSVAQCNHVINTRRCKQSLRIASLNIGTMTGKSRELADLMKTQRIDVMCLQETRWGGNKARELGDGCKLFYSGGKKNTKWSLDMCQKRSG